MKKINVFFFNTIDLKPLLSENMALTFSLVVFTFSCIRVSTLKFSKQKFQKKKKNHFSLHSCPTLCDPMDCSPPRASVHGILQARILEWIAMPSSRGSSTPGIKPTISYVYLYCQTRSSPLVPPGKPCR